nr:RNA-dependent RNA polymerase [Diplodia seriata narnavirus 1]
MDLAKDPPPLEGTFQPGGAQSAVTRSSAVSDVIIQKGDLPSVRKTNFFEKPEDWSDKKLSQRVRKNPIVDLCLRLATCTVGKNSNYCYDPKRLGQQMSSSVRLYRMIGRYVGAPTFKRMLLASSRQWKFVEECWIANMHTVLLNQDFNPTKLDKKLFGRIQKYKIWFVRFFFSGRKRKTTSKGGKTRYVFVPCNFEAGLTALKNMAGWLQYAVSSDMSEHNADPPHIPFWKGWHSEKKSIELVWFGGHLEKWRTSLLRMEFNNDELSNLCQIRTFGRALPCPTANMCRKAFIEQMNILTKERKTDSKKLEVVRAFSERLGKRLDINSMPLWTHVSLSTSGCFERSQLEGGLASEVSSWIQDFNTSIDDVYVGSLFPGSFDIPLEEFILLPEYNSDVLCDVFGERLFPRPLSFYRFKRGLKALNLKKEGETSSILDFLYGSTGMSAKKRITKRMISESHPLPSTLGKTIALIATSLAERQGYYVNDIDGSRVDAAYYLKFGNCRIPVYTVDQMRNHLIYVPVTEPATTLDCLSEPGAKTRPLGKNQAWFTIVCRAMRFMAEPILARDGRARIGLRSTNKMWQFLKFVGKVGPEYPDPICQSTDYKSATDLIPLDVIEAMWSGFLSGLDKRHPFWVFASLITCKRRLFKSKKYRDLDAMFPEGILNQRGSFMGEPMSFLTLTLENLLVEEISAHYFLNGSPLWSPTASPDLVGDPICICGDDVASLRSCLKRILLFKEVATDLGWVFSWKDCVSRKVMIFCEDHALLIGKGKHLKMVYIDVIKSRLLTTMAREHSENRSSILGKGRMLSNQLDYFENKFLKIAVLGYFCQIFDRAYNYNVIDKCHLPLYLPPCCGGLGIPIVDSIMPSFMWPYIGYIYETLEIEDWRTKYIRLQALSALNSRVKHGISSDTREVLQQELVKYRFDNKSYSQSDESKTKKLDPPVPSTIYDDSYVINLLEKEGITLERDPYLKKYDFSALVNEAARYGMVPFDTLATELERILNFHEFIIHGRVREQRTYNRWVLDSSKFWKKIVPNTGARRKYLSDLGKSKFTSISDLEKKVLRSFSGWISVSPSGDAFNLINSGPSLKIFFSLFPANSDRRISGNWDHITMTGNQTLGEKVYSLEVETNLINDEIERAEARRMRRRNRTTFGRGLSLADLEKMAAEKGR